MTQPTPLACIGLGSNLGDRAKTLGDAVAALAVTSGFKLIAVSRFLETEPMGGPGGQGAYLNAAAVVETSLPPDSILRSLQEIENQAGRVRIERWGSRTLDLDLLLVGPQREQTAILTLPHPLMAIRRFVLAPLAEVAADHVHPTSGRTVAELLANLDRRPSRVEIVDRDLDRRDRILFGLINTLDATQWDNSPSVEPTFRVLIDPEFGSVIEDPIPTVTLGSGEADSLVAQIATLSQATRGA